MENRQFLHKMMLEQLDIYMQKMNLDKNFTSFTKSNSKQITDLNVIHKV
jgi:hypothetical protein